MHDKILRFGLIVTIAVALTIAAIRIYYNVSAQPNHVIELYKVTEANERIWRELEPSLTRDIKAGDTIYFEDIAIVVK